MKLFLLLCAATYCAVALLTLACICLGPLLRDDEDESDE